MWQKPEHYQLLWHVLASISLTVGDFFSGTKKKMPREMYMPHPELLK